MSTVIHVGPKGIRPFEHEEAFMGMLADAARQAEARGIAPERAMRVYKDRADSRSYQRLAQEREVKLRNDAFQRREDAFADTGGMHLPRDLDFVHRKVLEEVHPPNNAFKFFRTGSGIPAGARTHTVRRFMDDGEASWYRAGEDVPRAGGSQKEEQFPVRYAVTSVKQDIFEMLSSNFTNLGTYQRKLRSARRTIEAFFNEKLWDGDTRQKFYGVLTYPWLAKKVAATLFDGTASAANVRAELNAAANYPAEQSKQSFAPNRMLTTPRVRNYLMNTINSAASDKSIGEFFVNASAHINAIEEAWELKDIGGTGVDGILFYNDDVDSMAHEAVQGGLQLLPIQRFGFDNLTFMYLGSGGIVMRDVGNNILLLVTAAS